MKVFAYECHMILSFETALRPLWNRIFIISSLMFLSCIAVAQNPVSNFSVSASQGCVPHNVQFTNTSQNAVSYQWNFGNGNTSSQVNPSNVYTAAGTFTVTLTAVSANGNSDVHSAQIVVQPKPIAAFTVNISSGCQGSQVFSFQNLSQHFDSCAWDFGDGTTSSSFNPSHIYNISGVFNVTLVAINKAYGCSDVKVMNAMVTVFPSPDAVVTVNDSAVCDSGHVFAFSANMSNAVTWQWLFDDGATSSALNPSHVFADSGYHDVQLVMSSTNGCTDTITESDIIHIRYNPTPRVVFTDTAGCEPLYVALSTAYVQNATYLWTLGNGVTRNSFAVYYTYHDDGNYPVSLTVNYSSGCVQTVYPDTINVYERPSFIYSMSNNVGCAPLNVVFTNNSSAQNYFWLWDFGDGTTSTQAVPSHVYSVPGTYTVNLTATSVNGCTYGYPLGAKVKVNAPTASFNMDVTSGCPPLTVNFTNTSTLATNYFWDFGDGTTSTAQHPSHTFNAIGQYHVMLIVSDATGCVDTLLHPTAVNVSAATVNYTVPPSILGCAPHPVNFSDASGAASFLWDFGDGTTSTDPNPYHVYSVPGTYTVALTTWMPNGGCEQHIPNFQTFVVDGADPGFTYTVSPCPPYEVFFTDTSLNTSGWQWSFGDGGTSNAQHPSHLYPGPGTYNVTLVATTPNGCNTTLQANNSVVITGLGANASAVTADTVLPLNVQFYANSTGATYWIWSFGDGDSSTLENPVHVYTTPGPYNISLTIGNDSCVFTYDYPPMSFGSSHGSGGGLGGGPLPPPPRVYHCAPFTVNFSSPDMSALSWTWVFGDGDTSFVANPEHSYSDSGAFVPVLYMLNSLGILDTIVFTDTFFVVQPISDFEIQTTNLCNGVIVDLSTTTPGTDYLWNFGNGTTVTTPTASYTYPYANSSYMVSLSVEDTNGCPSFVAKSFAVNASSPLSSNIRRTCAGDSVLFSPGNVNYASYQWDFGDGSFSSSKNPKHAFADSGYYSVSLIVTDVNGCSLTFNLAYQIEVIDPLADFTYTPPVSNCTTLFVQFVNNSTGSNSWFWDFGDGTTSIMENPTHTYQDTGYYDVTLIASRSICSSSITIPQAFFVSNLIADFQSSISGDCVPSVLTLTDLSHDAASWRWDFGDGDTSSLQNPVHTYLTNPGDSITLTVTDVNGCARTMSALAPVLTEAKFASDETGGCIPLGVQFSDSSTNAVSWEWNFGDGNTSALQNPSHVYQGDGFYNVTLIVTAGTGCRDTIVLDSMIQVNTPVAAFSIDTVTGCSPFMADFDDQSINAVAWNWNFGNGSFSGNQDPSLIYSAPGYYDVKLVVENIFGCKDSVDFDSLIHVRGPQPDFHVSGSSGCAPYPVNFNNVSLNGVYFEWQFGDGEQDTVVNPLHIYNDPGTYMVSLFAYDSSGCSAIYTYPVPVTVGSSPVTSFIVNTISGCAPLQVTIDDTGTSADSLVWDFGDGTVVTGNAPAHTYVTPGVYAITLIAYNAEGCTDTMIYPDSVYVNSQPSVAFSADITAGCNPVTVQFTDASSGTFNPVYNWDFGNGDFSALQNPAYTYTQPGVYTVSLIVTNEGGCSDTVTLVDYIDVYDPAPPPATDLYRVSVESPLHVMVEWQKTTVNDLAYYIVYRYNTLSGQFDSIAQIYQNNTGVNNNIPFFNDSNVLVNSSTYAYKVQAVDLCGNSQPLSQLRAHETILLQTTAGHQKVDLSWTPYEGCSINGYEIYRKDAAGSSFIRLASLPDNVFSFTDTTAACPSPYEYKILGVAVCNNAVYDSWSNVSSATPTSDIADQIVDISRATVVDDQFVLVEWSEPSVLPYLIDRYDVYRSTDKMNYQLIASVPSLMHEYEDMQTAVGSQEYYYKILVQNVCNVNARYGVPGSSILLQKVDLSSGYMLKWSSYFDWTTGVEFYVIEKLNSNGVWEEMERVPGSVTEWEEK